MGLREVWVYGYGDGGRLRYQVPSAEKAVKAFLERQVASGEAFREVLRAQGREKVHVCVKDPSVEGTQQDPNYPAVVTVDIDG